VYGGLTRRQLRDFARTLPEWTDPQDSGVQIENGDILRYGGFSEDEIAEVEGDLEESALADTILLLPSEFSTYR